MKLDHDKLARGLRSGRSGTPKGAPAPTSSVDHDKLASLLGAERRGTVEAVAGPFAAVDLALEVAQRLHPPAGGGQPTDPSWNERRLIPLKRETLEKLDQIATSVRKRTGTHVQPLQIAAAVLEKFVGNLDPEEIVLEDRPEFADEDESTSPHNATRPFLLLYLMERHGFFIHEPLANGAQEEFHPNRSDRRNRSRGFWRGMRD